MTIVHCPLTDCGHNEDGICKNEEIEICGYELECVQHTRNTIGPDLKKDF